MTFRTPLSGFLSFARLLERFREFEPEEAGALVRQFRESAEHVFTLLENLLTWSRMQRGTVDWDPQTIDFGSIARRNVELLQQSASLKQIDVRMHVNEPCMIDADVNMLDTAVRNLLSNAIKFTPPGGTVELTSTEDDAHLVVTIADNGIGVPAEYVESVFQVGSRTQRKGTSGEQGSGLGLVLCREFITKHHGRIWLESNEGEGTRVSFTIPKIHHGEDGKA